MAWMMDTYSMQKGYAVPEIVTGKPISIGGSRVPARGDRRRRRDGDRARVRSGSAGTSPTQRCVVQGFGNVGGIAATELHEQGRDGRRRLRRLGRRLRRRTASTSRRCTRTSREHGSLEGSQTASTRITNEELLELECDVLVARRARGPGHRRRTRGNLRCRLVAEGANGPTSIDGRPDPRRARASPCCRTSSRTRAASPSPTSSGCRTSGGSSGTATRSAGGSPTSWRTHSTASGTSRSERGITLRDAALVAGDPRGLRRARGARDLPVR